MNKKGKLNKALIVQSVDFFRTYADMSHHGKEENILFNAVDKKKLKKEERDMLGELLEEHIIARRNIGALSKAVESNSYNDAVVALQNLIVLYPKHIEKEDTMFFPICIEKLNSREEKAMLAEYNEYDRVVLQERYKSIITLLESKNIC